MAASNSPDRIAQLERQVLTLTTALAERVMVEQAKGVIAERYLVTVEEAFELVRKTARGERRKLQLIAGEVVQSVAHRECPVARYAA